VSRKGGQQEEYVSRESARGRRRGPSGGKRGGTQEGQGKANNTPQRKEQTVRKEGSYKNTMKEMEKLGGRKNPTKKSSTE